MKKLLLFGFALLGSGTAAVAQLIPTGGPDAYGYTWRTSAAANGPVYNWVDIRARGVRVQGLDDDNIAPTQVVLPFDFPFYLRSYNQVRVGSNGYVSLTYPGGPAPASLAQPFPVLPTVDAQRTILGAFIADLNFSNAGPNAANPGQCYYMVNNDSVVVTYINAPFWNRAAAGQPDWRGANTFQIILSRLDSSVTYQYQNMDPAPPAPSGQSPNQLLVGIEDLTGTLGLQAGLNQVPANNSAVRFYRPRTSTFQFTDLAANGFGNPEGAAFFALLNQPIPVQASVSNTGNTTVGAFDVTARITNRPGQPQTPLNNQRITVNGLGARRDTLITFPLTYTPTTASPSLGTGVFQVRTQTIMPTDQNATNNTNNGMFVVVDTANTAEFVLAYDEEPFNEAVGFGAGVYFQPPYYPAELRATEAPIVSQGTVATSGVKIKVYADNGANGTPGTLLYADSIAQADVTVGALNTFVLNTPVQITSGGFYISWVVDSSESMFIGAHGPATASGTIPVSRRNYEVINGTFAPYRTATDNILISATMRTRVPLGMGEDRTGQLALQPAFPNPATDRTTIGYSLRTALPVTLTVSDLLGRQVRMVGLGQLPAGDHRYELNTAALAPGVYTYSLQTGNVKLTRKLLVQR